ncbi:oxidoreductase [Neptunitalea chrysea]|uniref:Oxidoreductase n=1 Tax=Neptunitalea chrysea TaxID=1647581 RepID=A0A9W6ETP1_9FLAO|nr:Gfo/Idh/MocA family oxidoreductase [Neptunitalea chrysea]GLB51379.1 oxidoreductase [Neptunitalea chrysea]
MEQEKVNWAILGTGKIARQFATDLDKVPNAVKYVVASRSEEKASNFASEFNFETSYGSYEALAKDTKVDAVYIASPHALHAEHTKLFLKHKISVLCEKPFAMNTNEVQEMISLAKKQDTLLMEALWTHFLPHYNYVLELVSSGKMGAITSLKADFGFYKRFNNNARLFNKELGGGSLLDIGIYPIFAALTLLGIPENIEADATYYDNGADSSCQMEFTYKNNVIANLKSTLLEKTATEAVIECEKGTIHILGHFHKPTQVRITTHNVSEIKDFGYTTIGYNFEATHFTELILNGKKESPIMTYNKSLALINLLDKVRELINLHY